MDEGNRADEEDPGEETRPLVSQLAPEGEDAENGQNPHGRRSSPSADDRVPEELQRKSGGKAAGARDLRVARLEEAPPSLHQGARGFDGGAHVVVNVPRDAGEVPADRESRENGERPGEGRRSQAAARA